MTSTTLTRETSTPRTRSRGDLAWWFSDVWQMTLRNVRHVLRSPELVMFSLVQPVLFILLFTYVFGGAIDVGGERYAQFLLPGILVQMALYGSAAGTTIGVAAEMREGLMDRFRSMPMSRTSVLIGRTLSEIFRNVCVAAVTVGVGLLVGFRFRNGFLPALAGLLLLMLFGYAVSWFAAYLGLVVRNAEAAQAVGGVWIFPFTLLSSAFVPTGSMPDWLQVYAAHSPMTAAVNALRALFTGGPAASPVLQTLAWSIGLIVVFAPLAVRRYGTR
ncbi:Daunorubicin/doxorubicin resistance ABC transporter permease protein DrrB [Streptomyces sp. ADI96-02]|uniref:ABC transporter permease n=1 Tax=unclassified Streptomyces TaxID=2593676 RepID=UPI000F556388|nr:ABC transporter permease [Streptomyces sp. ADI96-02]RPK57839.1 Daunorubicin/doxorubicin resistance ABC transporter permease protein DrrB [Streptomyces sp. ADI96-02]